MQRVQRLLRSVDRVQQRSRWLGFPLAVMGKFRDDHGGALTTVIAYNAFFAFFPLLLVVVTVLGFLLGRDSGFQQRLLGSAVADFPIIGDQVQDNIHGLRGSGVGLVIGLVAFAWGARSLTQVAQHAMAEIWNIPGRQRPGFWARQVRGLLLLVVFAVGLAATSLLTWLGSYGGKAVAVALANLAAAAAVNVGLFLLAFRVLTPQQIPTRQLLAGALVAGVALRFGWLGDTSRLTRGISEPIAAAPGPASASVASVYGVATVAQAPGELLLHCGDSLVARGHRVEVPVQPRAKVLTVLAYVPG